MITNFRQRCLAVIVPAGLCLVFAAVAALSAAGFNGTMIHGLNSDVGTVGRGQKFDQRLSVYNCTLTGMSVTVSPTCGCALKGPGTFNVAPMSAISIVIPYRVRTGTAGRQSRIAIVDYQVGSHKRRRIARVMFLLVR